MKRSPHITSLTDSRLTIALVGLAGLILGACSSATSGKPIVMPLFAHGDGNVEGATGGPDPWQYTLEAAQLSLGPVYVYAPPETTMAPVAQLWRTLTRSTARAHGGDDNFDGQRVLAEWTGTVTVDALSAEPQRLGSLRGEAGPAKSLSLRLTPAAGDDTLPAGAQGYVRGTATRGDVTLPFEGVLVLPSTPLSIRVDNVAVPDQLDRSASGWDIALTPTAWLEDVDFATLSAGAERPARIERPAQAGNAWYAKIHRPGAYAVSATPGQ